LFTSADPANRKENPAIDLGGWDFFFFGEIFLDPILTEK
jgi:hypothetical protein